MIVTYYCKKGGVGKTTLLGEHADYLSSLGKKILLISIDDQNSIFDMFGKYSEVFIREDNYLEHVLTNSIEPEEAIIKIRDHIDGIKTLNIDMISKKLTLERQFEKQFVKLIQKYEKQYDYVFIDLPPASNRTSEVLFDLCEQIILIVELNKLGVNGFYNTLQYFTDADIELDKIQYVIPNGHSKIKSLPAVALEELKEIATQNLRNAKVLNPVPEKSIIQTLQHKGIVIFDEDVSKLNYYQKSQKKILMDIFTDLYKTAKI